MKYIFYVTMILCNAFIAGIAEAVEVLIEAPQRVLKIVLDRIYDEMSELEETGTVTSFLSNTQKGVDIINRCERQDESEFV